MPNAQYQVEVHNVGSYFFRQTGNSTRDYGMGMRQMQARAFEKRNAQYLLIQAPPACGKSRALMFLALDKVINQGVKKVFVAVPQIAIGSSFADTNLTEKGFFADWKIDPQYNLCTPVGEAQKVGKVLEFLDDPEAQYLLCSHATLNDFFKRVTDKNKFDNCLVAVDEFHHVSEAEENRLGNVIHSLMTDTSAHIIAMTGSYFRGDSVPVLSPEDESKFARVIYTYYEQLNGYKYLKSLGIDYAFYTGNWVKAAGAILDTTKKCIIHIPNVNSKESTGDKLNEVGAILDLLGTVKSKEADTGLYLVETSDGRLIKVADLVTNDGGMQGKTMAELRKPEVLDSLNIIIALGMAKEGFDWPQCEYALTVGYRASLTEVIQIIGRTTRDYPRKTHAQFTNLLAYPRALLNDVTDAVNSLLKAITLSLLMEQVLAPNIHFRKRSETDDLSSKGKRGRGRSGDTTTGDNTEGKEGKEGADVPSSDPNALEVDIDDEHIRQKAIDILNDEALSITEKLMNTSSAVKSGLANGGEGVCRSLAEDEVADILNQYHLDLTDHEIAVISEAIVTAIILKAACHGGAGAGPEAGAENGSEHGSNEQDPNPSNDGADFKTTVKPKVVVDEDNTAFLKINDKLINVNELDFNLIESINPFANAYMFISKALDPDLLKQVQEQTLAAREKITKEKALDLWPYINAFVKENKREPSIMSRNDFERRLAAALAYLKEEQRKRMAAEKAGNIHETGI